MEKPRLVKLRREPERKEEMARWFHDRWGIALEAYRESMDQCLEGGEAVPQWYMIVNGLRPGRGSSRMTFMTALTCGPISALSMWSRSTGGEVWPTPSWTPSGRTWGSWGRNGYTWSPTIRTFVRNAAGSF